MKDLVKVRDSKMTVSGMFLLANVRLLIDSFDCIHRLSLWLILRQYKIPDNIVAIIQSLYKSSKSCIKLNGMTGDWFDVVTGIRQGCILSPLLFATVMDWIMKKSVRNYKEGL